MSANSSIEWTDTTWNPVRGCALVSAGCRNCYAMKQAHRFSGPGGPYEGLTELGPNGPRWTGRARVVPELLDEPRRWRKPRRVFVNSMSDLFHEDVPDEQLAYLFGVMANSKAHTFQVLTKRPSRMRDFLSRLRWQVGFALLQHLSGRGDVWALMPSLDGHSEWERVCRPTAATLSKQLPRFVAPNIWLGVSCENQATADERIPLLLQTPAAIRFVSAEPLLGPLDLEAVPLPAPGAEFYGLRGVAQPLTEQDDEPDDWKYWTRREAKLNWVIVGGESGAHARPCEVAWVRRIVSQCRTAGVSCFVKQLGARPMARSVDDVSDLVWRELDAVDPALVELPFTGGLRDRKGGDPLEWPEDLRVREFPKAVSV